MACTVDLRLLCYYYSATHTLAAPVVVVTHERTHGCSVGPDANSETDQTGPYLQSRPNIL